MKFDRLYRASLYVTLFLATLLLSIDAARDNRFAMAYPLAVGVASILAFVTVDRDPRKGLPREFANFLSLIGFGLGFLEWLNDSNLLLLAIGHTLVYLQVVKYALPKTVEDDWYFFLLALVQVVIGVHISQSDEVSILLFLWMLSSIWTFGLFFLRRESVANKVPAGVIVSPRPDRDEPYPGLFDAGFMLSTVIVVATTLLLGSIIFFLMPRWSVKGPSRVGKLTAAKHLTGFTDSVKLDEMGEILENDAVVLSVELSDESDRVLIAPPDMLLRGVTLIDYNKGSWDRQSTMLSDVKALQRPIPEGTAEIRQRIKMEPSDSDVLFSLRCVFQVRASASSEVRLNRADGTIYRGDIRENPNDPTPPRAGKFDYQVISAANPMVGQPGEDDPDEVTRKKLLDTGALEDELKAINSDVLKNLSVLQQNSPEVVAQTLERYLRDGEFTYTLRVEPIDRQIDPVIDFLKNRKSGHCEYFASALTLMCRAAGVPARMVNGFKGGDWNELSRVTIVREKYAHSWVEALVGTLPNGRPHWITFDPTPSRQREDVVAKVGGGAFKFRFLSDSIRTMWTFNVVGFDSDRQERKIYGPIRQVIQWAARGFRIFYEMIRDLPSWLYFEDFGHFFSMRGFVVSVVAMLSLLGIFTLLRSLWKRISKKLLQREAGTTAGDSTVAFYHRLVKLLADNGLVRPAAETPREFAHRAVEALTMKWPTSEAATLPLNVIDAFYSNRFGCNELPPEMIRDLETRLESLENRLAARD